MFGKLEGIAIVLVAFTLGGIAICSSADAAGSDVQVTKYSTAEVDSICLQPSSLTCVGQNFDAILRLARHGDSYASVLLYRSVEGCANRVNLAKVSKTETHVIDANGTVEVAKVESGAANPIAKTFQRTSERCSAFSEAQIANVNELRWLAAAAGDARAQNNLVALVGAKVKHGNGNGDVEKLFSLLQSNADAGKYETYFVLSRVYSDGVLVPADYVKSYAYAKAYALKTNNQSDPVFASRISTISSHLSDDERVGAENLSRQLASATN